MAFRFKKFQVFKDAQELHKEIIVIVNKFPREYIYIADQIKRSSLSVILNIAEGSSKQSDKDFNRYITIALDSIDEVVATLDVCLYLDLLDKDKVSALEAHCLIICNQLGGFSKYLKTKIS